MKKKSVLLLVLALSLGLFGCNSEQSSQNNDEDQNQAASEKVAEIEEETAASTDNALTLFDSGDREGAVEMLHEVEANGNEGVYVSEHVTITGVYAYDPASNPNYISADGKQTYNLYIFGEVAAPSEDLANMQIGALNDSMISITMNNKNDYSDSTNLNTTNSDLKAIAEKGYNALEGYPAAYGLETGDAPYKFVARISVSANDFNYENGIVAVNIENLFIDGKHVGGDNELVFPISDITVLNSPEELDNMIANL